MKLAILKFIGTFNHSWQLKILVLSRGVFSIKGRNIFLGCGMRGCLSIEGKMYKGCSKLKQLTREPLFFFYKYEDLNTPCLNLKYICIRILDIIFLDSVHKSIDGFVCNAAGAGLQLLSEYRGTVL